MVVITVQAKNRDCPKLQLGSPETFLAADTPLLLAANTSFMNVSIESSEKKYDSKSLNKAFRKYSEKVRQCTHYTRRVFAFLPPPWVVQAGTGEILFRSHGAICSVRTYIEWTPNPDVNQYPRFIFRTYEPTTLLAFGVHGKKKKKTPY